jgi:DNA polymerase delta subunit 2
MYKYVSGTNRLRMMEHILRWRNNAPTAPDTLWSYPFQESDPFVITECPHVFFVGNQPSFGTTIVEGPEGQQVRLISVPSFKETGVLVLVDGETLECETVSFSVRMPKEARNGDEDGVEMEEG